MKIILRYGNNIQWLQHKQLVKHSSNILWNTCSLQRLQHQTIIISRQLKWKFRQGLALRVVKLFIALSK